MLVVVFRRGFNTISEGVGSEAQVVMVVVLLVVAGCFHFHKGD